MCIYLMILSMIQLDNDNLISVDYFILDMIKILASVYGSSLTQLTNMSSLLVFMLSSFGVATFAQTTLYLSYCTSYAGWTLFGYSSDFNFDTCTSGTCWDISGSTYQYDSGLFQQALIAVPTTGYYNIHVLSNSKIV